jgi:hypothetical protein
LIDRPWLKLADERYILAPVCYGDDWALLEFHLAGRTINFYNSLSNCYLIEMVMDVAKVYGSWFHGEADQTALTWQFFDKVPPDFLLFCVITNNSRLVVSNTTRTIAASTSSSLSYISHSRSSFHLRLTAPYGERYCIKHWNSIVQRQP